MRKYWYAGLVAMTALFTAVMTGTAFASHAVLTYDTLDGAAVAVGDVLHGHNVGDVTFYDSSSHGAKCSTSHFTATVTSNPPAPGSATETLDTQTFSSCVPVGLLGVSSVKSVTVNNLPYNVSASSSFAVTVTPRAGTAIQTTVVLGTLLGNITCVYQSNSGSLSGTASNTDNSITFTSQQFNRTSGPTACTSPANFTAKYYVTDSTHTHPVFTN